MTDREIRSIYNHVGRSYLFNVDFYYLEERKKYCVDAFHTGNVCIVQRVLIILSSSSITHLFFSSQFTRYLVCLTVYFAVID